MLRSVYHTRKREIRETLQALRQTLNYRVWNVSMCIRELDPAADGWLHARASTPMSTSISMSHAARAKHVYSNANWSLCAPQFQYNYMNFGYTTRTCVQHIIMKSCASEIYGMNAQKFGGKLIRIWGFVVRIVDCGMMHTGITKSIKILYYQHSHSAHVIAIGYNRTTMRAR